LSIILNLLIISAISLSVFSYSESNDAFATFHCSQSFAPFVNLSTCNFSGQKLFQMNLTSADMSGVNLSNSDLQRIDFTNALLNGADLSGSNYYQGLLIGTDLTWADLSNN